MQANKEGKYPNGLSVEEINEHLVDRLFVGTTKRKVTITLDSDNPDIPTTNTKYWLTYEPLSAGLKTDLSIYYIHLEPQQMRRMESLLESAKSILDINDIPVVDKYTLKMYDEFFGDTVVFKTMPDPSPTGKFVNRDLKLRPLSDFEKRYLVFRNMDMSMMTLFHAHMTIDHNKLIDTFIEEDTPATRPSLLSNKDKNTPLV